MGGVGDLRIKLSQLSTKLKLKLSLATTTVTTKTTFFGCDSIELNLVLSIVC